MFPFYGVQFTKDYFGDSEQIKRDKIVILNQNNNQMKSIDKDIEVRQKKEVKLFVIVMVIFTIGMAILLFYDVRAWWIWYIYFAVWTLIEWKIAKNIKLKWWHWTLIILAILSIDWIVLELIEYIKR